MSKSENDFHWTDGYIDQGDGGEEYLCCNAEEMKYSHYAIPREKYGWLPWVALILVFIWYPPTILICGGLCVLWMVGTLLNKIEKMKQKNKPVTSVTPPSHSKRHKKKKKRKIC